MNPTEAEQELINEIILKIKTKLESGLCQELAATWIELWDGDERTKRKNILAEECVKELQDILEEVLLREKKTKDNYIDRIETLLSEINDLQKNLEIAIPYEDVESLPLHNMAFHLNKKAEKYRIIKNERKNKLNDMMQREADLCKQLGMIPAKTDYSDIPTKMELKQLENQIAALEQEKINRSLTYKEQCLKISSLFKELDLKPNKFEKELISYESMKDPSLSNENMKEVEEILRRLECQVEDSKQLAQELTDKLKTVWHYLDEPEEHGKLFLQAHSGYSLPVINAMKEELSRCETKKRENISKIVTKMREVLVQEWDKCMIAQTEREKFRPFTLDCFTEDLCELHELEIERLKNYYRNNEQIFNLIAKHDKLFKKLIELENISKNANRYYNRGGQLLQEERERKTLTKELPLVEEELRALLQKYEEDHEKPFMSFGAPMLFVLDEQWNAHFDQKTIDKMTRKKGPEKNVRTPLGKRTLTTPGSSVASKISRLNNNKIVSSASRRNTPWASSKKVNVRRRKCVNDEKPDPVFPVDATYDEFQTALQAKVESLSKQGKTPIRSTLLNDDGTPRRPALREKNTPVLRSATASSMTTPTKQMTPMYSPSIRKTPKTLPRTSRRLNRSPHLTAATMNRRPLII